MLDAARFQDTLKQLRGAGREILKPADAIRFAQSVGLQPDPWQREVLGAESKRMILNCSRQAGKSTVASVLALFVAVTRPGSLVLLVSPSLRQSSELFRKITHWCGKLNPPPHLTES